MGYSIEVYDHNFEEEVLEQSYRLPTIVDFFATWCGPCQMLKPMLENVAKEYDCVVAKVDIDNNQYLANAYQIEGVPDVKVFRDGKVIDGFVGVLPEPQLAEFLANCQIYSGVDRALAAVRVALADGDQKQAQTQLEELLQSYPENRRVMLAAAQCFVTLDRPEAAMELVSAIGEDEKPYYGRSQAIKALIDFARECREPTGEKEIDRQFTRACCLTVAQQYEEALTLFLEIVERDRKYRDDAARKATLVIFELLGNDHPLTSEYRKKLMLVLY